MIVFDCSRLYPFEYNGLQPHTSFLLIFSHILRVEGNTVVYLTVTLYLPIWYCGRDLNSQDHVPETQMYAYSITAAFYGDTCEI